MLYVCRACGFRGMPLFFDSPEDFAKFRSEVAAGEVAGPDSDDEPIPGEVQAVLHLRPQGRRRVAGAVVWAGMALPFLAYAGLAAFAALVVTADSIRARQFVVPLGSLVAVAIGVIPATVFLRVSRRMWRGG